MSRGFYNALDEICPDFHEAPDDVNVVTAPMLVGDQAMHLLTKARSFPCVHCYPTTISGFKHRLLTSLFIRPDRSLFFFEEPIVRIVIKKICGDRRIPVRDHIWVKVSDVIKVYPNTEAQLVCLTLFRSVRLLIIDYFICEQDLVRVHTDGQLEFHVLLLLSMSMFSNWTLHTLFVHHLIEYDESMPPNSRRYPAETEEALSFYSPPFLLDVVFDYDQFAKMMRERSEIEYSFNARKEICKDVFCYCPIHHSKHMSLSNMRKRYIRNASQYRYHLHERLSVMQSHVLIAKTPIPCSSPIPAPPLKYVECCVCLDASANVVFQPCGHAVCCDVCSAGFKVCVLCRAPIQTTEAVAAVAAVAAVEVATIVSIDVPEQKQQSTAEKKKEPWCIKKYMIAFGHHCNDNNHDLHVKCLQFQHVTVEDPPVSVAADIPKTKNQRRAN